MNAISTDILPVERACPSRGYVVRTKARRGTTAYWSAIRDYIPADGEIIVYSDYKTLDEKNIPGVKIGTGSALLQDLPFIDDADAVDIAAKYTKPAAGIPKTDLDSSVQASLDKADAALPADTPFKTINGESVKGSGNINTEALELAGAPFDWALGISADDFLKYFRHSATKLLARGIAHYDETNSEYLDHYFLVSGQYPDEQDSSGTIVFDDGNSAYQFTITRLYDDEEATEWDKIENLKIYPSHLQPQTNLNSGSATEVPSVKAVKDRVEPIEAKIPSGASSSNKMVTASELNTLALAVAGKADIFGTSVPLSLEDNELTLKYNDFQFDLGGDDMTLTLRLSYGLISNSSGVRVYAGRGLAFGDEGVLEANPGDGLAFDPNGAIVPDFAFVQAAISDLATIRSGSAAGATAVQPADVSDCVRSATISTIVTLSQAEYDALANKDANTFYVII